MIIYIGKQRPWEIQFNNRMEFFNECGCLLLQYHQILFTDFLADVEFKDEYVAHSFLFSTYLIIAINCALIGLEFGKSRVAAYHKKQSQKKRKL
jgi:hypothetical protein